MQGRIPRAVLPRSCAPVRRLLLELKLELGRASALYGPGPAASHDEDALDRLEHTHVPAGRRDVDGRVARLGIDGGFEQGDGVGETLEEGREVEVVPEFFLLSLAGARKVEDFLCDVGHRAGVVGDGVGVVGLVFLVFFCFEDIFCACRKHRR